MPFDATPKERIKNSGLKPIAGQKSMFDDKPKLPTQQQFQEKVEQAQETLSGHKRKAAELFIQFNKAIMDKTLSQNRNVFNIETEREMLHNMIQLAIDLNNDPIEQEGAGALSLIVVLLKTCLAQRDRLNEMEYCQSLLQKKIDSISNDKK